jgi:hypothetical protein
MSGVILKIKIMILIYWYEDQACYDLIFKARAWMAAEVTSKRIWVRAVPSSGMQLHVAGNVGKFRL